MTRKTKVKIATILAYITYGLMMLAIAGLAYLAIDFLSLMAWVSSGQTPTGFYLGRVSYIIISLIF